LPQIFNILKGDMNWVGPRPERPEMIGLISIYIPDFSKRTDIKPGVTGLSQINMDHCQCPVFFERKFEMDMFYINNRTLFLDIRIICTTILKVFHIKGKTVNKLLFVNYQGLKNCCEDNNG